jgi:hypothetical protein
MVPFRKPFDALYIQRPKHQPEEATTDVKHRRGFLREDFRSSGARAPDEGSSQLRDWGKIMHVNTVLLFYSIVLFAIAYDPVSTFPFLSFLSFPFLLLLATSSVNSFAVAVLSWVRVSRTGNHSLIDWKMIICPLMIACSKVELQNRTSGGRNGGGREGMKSATCISHNDFVSLRSRVFSLKKM